MLALVFVPAIALAQGEPTFTDLPGAPGETETAALVRALVRRVTELERRVDALEAASVAKIAEAPATDPEAQRLLVAAGTAKTKLLTHLDGYTYTLKADERQVYARAKKDHAWATIEADAKAFTNALQDAVGRASGLRPESKPTLESLVRWARGRTVYQVKGFSALNSTTIVLAPLDLATDIFPVEEKK